MDISKLDENQIRDEIKEIEASDYGNNGMDGIFKANKKIAELKALLKKIDKHKKMVGVLGDRV